MSLIDMSQFVFRGGRGGARSPQEPHRAPPRAEPRDTAVVYELVYDVRRDPAAGYTVGWTLVAFDDGAHRWSTSLAPRGAAPSAGARVARAVAVRVLSEQGVAVEGWAGESDDDEGSPTRFRARLRPAAVPPP